MTHHTGPHTPSELAAGDRRNPEHTTDHTVRVQAADGTPLNPCHPARARELLRQKRAIRVSRHPYTIRLLHAHQAVAMSVLYSEEVSK
ncbi:RRXRR domain-containing protein [Methylomonas sp. EFPC3]|uniref:RRXRR domain-containing protein n=1 Tax=unclassified Methylomonas TaxID=2608980 RepID=UPI0024180546|nr:MULTISPECIES: RRXRR domain-containing protein [unclassified Methylomonas]WFP50382.1 RRXRR domain-containing protein [Methylomonas sp. EFPC3]WGS85108.1 RRXRR domain-containing protein [Methylomonas sp. UP202]